MSSRALLKDEARELDLFHNRVIIAWVFMVIGLIFIITRLVFLQIIEHERYTTLSEQNRLKILPIPPSRGLIYDRNGVFLAENRDSFSLEVIPEKVKDMDTMLNELKKVIKIDDLDIQRFRKQMRQKRRFDTVPLRLRLTEKEISRFFVRRHDFEGVDIYTHSNRYYPLYASGVHAIGYVGRINERELKIIDTSNYSGTQYIGKVGIEKSYEAELHGKVGYQQVETNARGRVERVLDRTPPVPGDDLYLNIDMSLQSFIEGIIKDERAAVVALEPKNGAVLAMVSMPYYDPNLFVNGIDVKTYHALRDSPDRPLYNRALRGRYPPGSTIKAFVGLAGLEYGTRAPNKHTWCPGWYRLPGKQHKYRDWKRTGHGSMNLHHAIEQSCDVYFYDLARDLGIDRLHQFMTRFGFGKKTGIDISGELKGLMPSKAWKQRAYNHPWYPGETLIAGIGQGFVLSTPLQLAVATGILANRGHINQPRLVFAIERAGSQEMDVIPSTRQASINLRENSYWDAAINGMAAVVHGARGTARRTAYGSKYRFAGKTGTAQVIGMKQDEKYDARKVAKRFHDHALFVAFAPLESPRIAVAVIVENGGSGSKTAAPIAKKVMDCYLESLCTLEEPETAH